MGSHGTQLARHEVFVTGPLRAQAGPGGLLQACDGHTAEHSPEQRGSVPFRQRW